MDDGPVAFEGRVHGKTSEFAEVEGEATVGEECG